MVSSLVCVIIITHEAWLCLILQQRSGRERGLFFVVVVVVVACSSPASSFWADTNCRLRWKLHCRDPEASPRQAPWPCFRRQSISALSLDVGRNTSESSRACSCWPACLLLWMRPTRPRLGGCSESAGTGTWSPGWARSRAGYRLASAASWTLTFYSETKFLPAGEDERGARR